jgi:hypothetical protein
MGDPDDRQQQVMAHACTLLGSEEVAGQRAEVRHRFIGGGRGRVGGVDDRVDPAERVVEAITGHEIDAVSAADLHDGVPGLLER